MDFIRLDAVIIHSFECKSQEKEWALKEKRIRGSHVCKSCHSIMIPKSKVRGMFAVELLLWLVGLFLAPATAGVSLIIGLSYSVWRHMNKTQFCPVCGSTEVVPIDTPIGQKIIKELGLEEVK